MRAFTFLILLLLIQPAIAADTAPSQGWTINSSLAWLKMCSGKTSAPDCRLPFLMVMEMNENSRDRPGHFFCQPDETTIDQAILIFTKWLHDYPERLHLTEIDGISQSMFAAFPCP